MGTATGEIGPGGGPETATCPSGVTVNRVVAPKPLTDTSTDSPESAASVLANSSIA
ncbi:hypothetical protein [Rhodococcus globerulus]|uniref:hypothetical protein n=1 Tax=Rhodococcus globerulus TaxID=33008 RepID=UPI001E2BA987|nr:hypothetical protein [Rhodococcus globerulus]